MSLGSNLASPDSVGSGVGQLRSPMSTPPEHMFLSVDSPAARGSPSPDRGSPSPNNYLWPDFGVGIDDVVLEDAGLTVVGRSLDITGESFVTVGHAGDGIYNGEI